MNNYAIMNKAKNIYDLQKIDPGARKVLFLFSIDSSTAKISLYAL